MSSRTCSRTWTRRSHFALPGCTNDFSVPQLTRHSCVPTATTSTCKPTHARTHARTHTHTTTHRCTWRHHKWLQVCVPFFVSDSICLCLCPCPPLPRPVPWPLSARSCSCSLSLSLSLSHTHSLTYSHPPNFLTRQRDHWGRGRREEKRGARGTRTGGSFHLVLYSSFVLLL